MDNKLIKTAMVIGLIAVLILLLFLTIEVSSLKKQVDDFSRSTETPSKNSLSSKNID